MARVSRRSFLKTSAAAGAAAFFISSSRSPVLASNDVVHVAVVGFNGKGSSHIQAFSNMKDARLVALCDVDQNLIDKHVKALDKKNIKVQTYTDIRKLLENKEIDAIATATPNHWHSLITVWSCQAGKDVYVEKPCSWSIWEGRKCIEAAQKYNRIVQHGTQSRSNMALAKAIETIRGGELGKMLLIHGFCYKPRGSIGKVSGPQPIPAGVDYDLWCGPAPKDPLMRKRLHYDWHWVWPTGNGDIGNQGIHQMDICRWMTGQELPPARGFSFGGRFVVDDDATTPNTIVTYLDYQPVPVIFEVRGLPSSSVPKSAMDAYKPGDVRVGNVIHCEGGSYATGEGGGWIYDKQGKRVKQILAEGAEGHQANFIKAVKSRKMSDLNAPITVAHPSCVMFHIANASYRVGKEVPYGDIADACKGNSWTMDALERLKSHMAANGATIDKTKITFGPTLNFDTKDERFTGEFADAANKYVKRDYRKPFEVPESV